MSTFRPNVWTLPLPHGWPLDGEESWPDLLSPAERARADRIRIDETRREVVASRALLRRVLSDRLGGPPQEWEIVADPDGRPCLANPAGAPAPAVDFNLTHTRGLVCVALVPSGRIGVDAEKLDRADEIRRVAERVFAPAELAALAKLSGPAADLRCVVLWTLKEAWSKATGAGLRADFRAAQFSLPAGDLGPGATLPLDPRWRFDTRLLPSGHVVAVAAERTGVAFHEAGPFMGGGGAV